MRNVPDDLMLQDDPDDFDEEEDDDFDDEEDEDEDEDEETWQVNKITPPSYQRQHLS
jgi:hypothetical protein